MNDTLGTTEFLERLDNEVAANKGFLFALYGKMTDKEGKVWTIIRRLQKKTGERYYLIGLWRDDNPDMPRLPARRDGGKTMKESTLIRMAYRGLQAAKESNSYLPRSQI